MRLLLLREAGSRLIPAGTPSPDSAHLIITWPSGVGSRVIGVAFSAVGNEKRLFIELFLPVDNGRGNHARRKSNVREPTEAFRLLDEMTAAAAGSFIPR